jgi:hypothetical protein
MSLSKELYCNGYVNLSLRDSKNLQLLHRTISEINSKDIKGDFCWEEKYQNTQDLRPSVFEYNDIFISILFENNIPKIINDATQKQLLLTHVQLRRVLPGPSYMNWHRDTHFSSGDIVSVCPPAYKIIFFPDIEDSGEECLRLAASSHLCMNPAQRERDFINPGFSIFDKQLLSSNNFDIISAKKSKSKMLFFDTSCLHAALPSHDEDGSLRLIYLFMPKEQFDERYASKAHHFNLNKIYQEKFLNE